ncbi:MAG: AAA family ATPase [Bacilli bacterium]|nr:AAA family ATPase [Bacilli bacterium]
MYLKQINAYGFKSFADKIDIKLDDKITCIVGPNGSGKSNVVDAVRWVLGEQSVKQLRGDGTMSDVIFSGSKSRKALNVATVELVFDNSDHYLNVPYTEISIKRKAFRSGENEYFLNGERCRLKDVISLLMDSGIGRESYNIISQGEVEKIISSSSLDRRVIIEDAAGVVKYKKRKEEALKKLDKTHTNLDRVEDIIRELQQQVEPLREQSKKAQEYLENKKALENLEVALLGYDIYNDNEEKKTLVEKLKKIEDKLVEENVTTNNSDLKVLEQNNLLSKKEEELRENNKALLDVVALCEKLNSEKMLLQEKSKNSDSDNSLLLRNNLEERAELTSQINVMEEEISRINERLNLHSENLIAANKDINNIKDKKKMKNQEYSRVDQELITINHKIDSLKLEMDSGVGLPLTVKKILTDDSLLGIYNTIGNVLEIDSLYIKALDVAINSSKNFIITEDEESSKKAINYLKDNHLGRATFFPLSVIKSRYIDDEVLTLLKQDSSFIGVLSDLVRYDCKFKNIILNQLGTVLVASDMDGAIRIGRRIYHRYKIVTLDGDVLNVGGSMSGGSSNTKYRSAVTIRQEIDSCEKRKDGLLEDKENLTNEISELTKNISEFEEKYFVLSREEVNLKEELKEKMKLLESKNVTLENINREISSLENASSNKVSEREQELINLYYEKTGIRDNLKNKVALLTREISDLKTSIEEFNATYKLKTANIRALEKEQNDLKIRINRLDLRLDNMLNTLNEEYSLTLEAARAKYTLDIEVELARERVNLYKSNIRKLGMVNLASIEEFERVNTRYEFLSKQKDDLLNAQENLLDIMREMDGVIEEEFSNTYKKVNSEFTKVFKELFSGGNAYLKLTNEDDMLTTGIDIVASPPGKKLSSITLLSGGEKTLTAISLLFAILNVREVPFCLFDEVEAALDEANVDQFGKYLDNYKNKTQFLIITHKKKTMEYADTLYGITMQESGVSKLVSVKLNEHVDTI